MGGRSAYNHRRFADTPILVLSADPDPRVRDQAIVRGATAFFSKPLTPVEVARYVEELISSRFEWQESSLSS